MINLTNTTFISAIKIESSDRYQNAKSVLGYLNEHFETNILLCEVCDSKSNLNFLDDLKNLNITLIKEPHFKVFHRTKFLNNLLRLVKTPVTCNYDIDVILPIESYLSAESLILKKHSDVIYPFPIGWAQQQVLQSFDRKEFNEKFSLDLIEKSEHKNRFTTNCGHAFFIDTKKYKECGGENENFISYGPEDVERLLRFNKLGLKVSRLENGTVYHFEHERGQDSAASNPYFLQNNFELEKIKLMGVDEVRNYLPKIK